MDSYWIGLGFAAFSSGLWAWAYSSGKKFACHMARQILLNTRETDYTVLCSRVEGNILGKPAEWVESEIRKEATDG